MITMALSWTKRLKARKNWLLLLPMLIIPVLLAGCVHLISYYDSATYQNLTDLKASTSILFQDLTNDPTGKNEKNAIESLRLGIEKAYEYEKGKDKNDETITQITQIRELYSDMLALLQKKGKLAQAYLDDRKEQMVNAFDMAIDTEKTKIEKK